MIDRPHPGDLIVHGSLEVDCPLFLPLVDAIRYVHVRRAVDPKSDVYLTWGEYRDLIGEEKYAEEMRSFFDARSFEDYFADEFWDGEVERYWWHGWESEHRDVLRERPIARNPYQYCVEVLPTLERPDEALRDWHACALANGAPVPALFVDFKALIDAYPETVELAARAAYRQLPLGERLPLPDEQLIDLDTGDGIWPEPLCQGARHWLPPSILERYGEYLDLDWEWADVYAYAPEGSEIDDNIAQAFRDLGYPCVEARELVNEAAGFGRPIGVSDPVVYAPATGRPMPDGHAEPAEAAPRYERRLVLLPSGQFVFMGVWPGYEYFAGAGACEFGAKDVDGVRRPYVRLIGVAAVRGDSEKSDRIPVDHTLWLVDGLDSIDGGDDDSMEWRSLAGRWEIDDAGDLAAAFRRGTPLGVPTDLRGIPGWVTRFLEGALVGDRIW